MDVRGETTVEKKRVYWLKLIEVDRYLKAPTRIYFQGGKREKDEKTGKVIPISGTRPNILNLIRGHGARDCGEIGGEGYTILDWIVEVNAHLSVSERSPLSISAWFGNMQICIHVAGHELPKVWVPTRWLGRPQDGGTVYIYIVHTHVYVFVCTSALVEWPVHYTRRMPTTPFVVIMQIEEAPDKRLIRLRNVSQIPMYSKN